MKQFSTDMLQSILNHSILAILYMYSPMNFILITSYYFLFMFQYVPMPVLYGVFLYMGVTSLGGVQVRIEELIALHSYNIHLEWLDNVKQMQNRRWHIHCSRLAIHVDVYIIYVICFSLQFFERILIMLMPAKYQPDYVYLRHVPIKRVHIFTIIQIVSMIIMWTLKSIKAVSITFPLMVR